LSDKEEVLDRLLEQLRRDFFGPRVPVPRQIVAALADAYEEGVNGQTATPTAIGDGFGNAWSAYCPTCKQKSMYISRPGDARCSKCESEQASPTPEKCPKCGSDDCSIALDGCPAGYWAVWHFARIVTCHYMSDPHTRDTHGLHFPCTRVQPWHSSENKKAGR
jgi:hypothetical protein